MITAEFMKAKIREYWESKVRKPSPKSHNNPSSMCHPCLRSRVFDFTDGDKAAPMGWEVQAKLEDGNLHESKVIEVLTGAGFRITAHDTPYFDLGLNISGRIDGKVFDPETREEVPLEVKALQPYAWKEFNVDTDIRDASSLWHRGYYGQLQTYLFLNAASRGFFALKEKVSGAINIIGTNLDYDYVDKMIIKTTEAVNEAVRTGKNFDKINSPTICPRCKFIAHCCPDYKSAGVIMLDDDLTLIKDLDRFFELKPLTKEYDELNEHFKKMFAEKQVSVGKYLITGKWQRRGNGKFWKVNYGILDSTGALVEKEDQ